MAERDIDLALRLVTSLPELVHLRVGYESAGWAERVVDLANPDHPLFPAAVGISARGAWNRGDNRPGSVAGGSCEGTGSASWHRPRRVPGRRAGRRWLCIEGDAHAALTHYEAEEARARRDDDPIRLVWTLFYVAICHAALRNPDAGLPAAQESVQVAEATANPTARSMAHYALGLVLKKSEPDRALALFDGCGGAGRVGAEFLVARHRVDGGRVDACRARRFRQPRLAISSGCSTTGTGWGTGASSGSTCGT